MKFRKAIAVALAAASVGCFCMFPASAANNPTYSKSINVKSGQVVTTKIYAKSSASTLASGIYTATQYDPEALSYTSEAEQQFADGTWETECTSGSVMCNPHPNEYGDGNFLFSVMNFGIGTDFSSRKLLASISFDVNKTGVTTIDNKIVEFYANDNDISDILDTGDINIDVLINGYALGDVDLSGSISVADAVSMQKCIANITTFNDLQDSLADVNGDGKVSVADAVTLQKKIANIVEVL